jgi:hypothetical protein
LRSILLVRRHPPPRGVHLTGTFPATVSYDSVYVVESLAPGQLRTGRDIYDNFLFPWAAEHKDIAVAYSLIQDSADLFAILAQIAAHCRSAGRAPILQLDVHGSKESLSLASGETLQWQDLATPLAAINEATRFNLLIIASSCFGYYLGRAIAPGLRAPAWGILGPKAGVAAGVLYSHLEAFYRELFTSLDLAAAIATFNPGLPYKRWKVNLVPAELLFCQGFRRHLAALGTPELYDDHVNALVARFAPVVGFNPTATAAARQAIVERLSDHSYWFARLRRRFLMLDLFPDNEPRFTLTLAQCTGAV